MKYNDRMFFPQPVLREGSDDFLASSFAVTAGDITINEADLTIDLTVQLASAGLRQLIDQGSARASVFLTCEDTRQIRLIPIPLDGTITVNVKSTALFGRVTLRPVIHTTRAIENWQSDELHAEYQGQASLPKASLLATADPIPFSVDRKRLKPLESIFELAASEETEEGTFQVDPASEKITISVHPTTKGLIEGMRNTTNGKDILLSAIYLPVVMEILSQWKQAGTSWEQHSWYRTFTAKCDSMAIDPESCEILPAAQKLLASPFLKIQSKAEELC